jgi:DNA repair protein RecN (Recombination protein N)
LDTFAKCFKEKEEVRKISAQIKVLQSSLKEVQDKNNEQRRAEELWRFQLCEIENLGLRRGEDAELLAEKRKLMFADKIFQLGGSAYASLYENDNSVLSQLALIKRSLQTLGEIEAGTAVPLANLESAISLLTDVAEDLRSYGNGIEFSPERLQKVESRLFTLELFKRKYNKTLEELLTLQSTLTANLNDINNIVDLEEKLISEIETAIKAYVASARLLSECRHLAARKLERQMTKELKQVAMETARFAVAIESADSFAEDQIIQNCNLEENKTALFAPDGIDQVEFLFSANPGESLRPLSRVASGGELSRLMLTLQTLGLNQTQRGSGIETLIFDEVDVGIGGRVADAVGKKLKALSRVRQLICVTHQPQIARFADQHYAVVKLVRDKRTSTFV